MPAPVAEEMRRAGRMPGVRDIVVIGGSAGAVEGMLCIAARLPARLAASVLLVIHMPPTAPSVLPRILERHGPLRSWHPSDGEALEHSVIYVAPPDHQLHVRAAGVGVVRGPRENGHRPAIDPLFRSASAAHGARVIAVVLSGNLDDGAAGLRAIADAGGAAIVQEPRGAVYPSMPESALEMVPEAEVVSLLDIAARIVALVGSPAPGVPPVLPKRRQPASPRLDPVELDIAASQALSEAGATTGLTCPECHGAIFDVDAAGVPTYRCRVGQAFSDASLMAAQDGSLEAALWIALRALEEGAEVAARLAERADRRGARVAARAFRRDESRHRARARVLRAAIDAADTAPEFGATDARASG